MNTSMILLTQYFYGDNDTSPLSLSLQSVCIYLGICLALTLSLSLSLSLSPSLFLSLSLLLSLSPSLSHSHNLFSLVLHPVTYILAGNRKRIPAPMWLQAGGPKRHSDMQIRSGENLNHLKRKYKQSLCLYCAGESERE